MPLKLIEGQYAPGDPICADLATDDVASAQEFYGRLFGWEFEDVSEHLMATKGRRMAAGFGLMHALDLAAPRWWLCLAAPDIDDLAERADAAGGSVSGKMELKGLGHAAVLEDPAGATAAMWQPNKLEPGALGAAHGGMVWAELVTFDPGGVAPFYESLFDVAAVAVEDQGAIGRPHDAVNLERKELEVRRMVAGIVAPSDTTRGSQVGARWRPYFQVDDLSAFVGQAEDAGAQVLDRHVSASRRAVAVMTDPQGAEFGVVEGMASRQVEDEST